MVPMVWKVVAVKLQISFLGRRKNDGGWTNIDSMLALLVFIILSTTLFFFSVDFAQGSFKFYKSAQKQIIQENADYDTFFSLFK